MAIQGAEKFPELRSGCRESVLGDSSKPMSAGVASRPCFLYVLGLVECISDWKRPYILSSSVGAVIYPAIAFAHSCPIIA